AFARDSCLLLPQVEKRQRVFSLGNAHCAPVFGRVGRGLRLVFVFPPIFARLRAWEETAPNRRNETGHASPPRHHASAARFVPAAQSAGGVLARGFPSRRSRIAGQTASS